MTVNCVSSTCRKPIESTWDFCPYCGEDNRSPHEQQQVPRHFHRYLHGSGHCFLCGEPFDEPYVFNRRWRMRLVTALLALSIVLFLTAGNIALGGIGKPSIGGSWIQSWYGQSVKLRHKGSVEYTTLGRHRITQLCLFGLLSGIGGGLLLFRHPLSWIARDRSWS